MAKKNPKTFSTICPIHLSVVSGKTIQQDFLGMFRLSLCRPTSALFFYRCQYFPTLALSSFTLSHRLLCDGVIIEDVAPVFNVG